MHAYMHSENYDVEKDVLFLNAFENIRVLIKHKNVCLMIKWQPSKLPKKTKN